MSELLSLLVVAWVVYLSDTAWWVGPESLVLTGRASGEFRVRGGPRYTVRQDRGFVFTKAMPPFPASFELRDAAGGQKASPERIRQLATAAAKAARPLAWMGAALWAFTFAIAPASIVLVGLHRAWLPVVAGLFGGAFAIVVAFARAWPVVYPASPRGWRSDAAPMFLAPLGAIRASDKLTRRALQDFEPIAVVGALASDEEFVRVARLWYFEDGDREASRRAGIRAEVDALVDSRGLRQAFHAAPPRVSPAMEGYCPRCRTQLMRTGGCCPDCLVAILPF